MKTSKHTRVVWVVERWSRGSRFKRREFDTRAKARACRRVDFVDGFFGAVVRVQLKRARKS